MNRSHGTTRRRQPLSLGQVVGFASLVMIICLGFLLRPRTTSHPGQHAVSLTRVTAIIPDTPAPAPMTDALAPTTPAQLFHSVNSETQAENHEPIAYFDGRPLRRVRQLTMLTTAYSPDERSCGKWADGFTASGYSVWTNGMKLVAADTRILPFGTLVSIPGYNDGKPVPVLDRGSKIKGYRLDLLYPTHEAALKWGAQRLTIDVWEYAD
ncbi:MAG: hypothetical protein Kow00105_13850 [Phycisphaeraceae bacterium]